MTVDYLFSIVFFGKQIYKESYWLHFYSTSLHFVVSEQCKSDHLDALSDHRDMSGLNLKRQNLTGWMKDAWFCSRRAEFWWWDHPSPSENAFRLSPMLAGSTVWKAASRRCTRDICTRDVCTTISQPQSLFHQTWPFLQNCFTRLAPFKIVSPDFWPLSKSTPDPLNCLQQIDKAWKLFVRQWVADSILFHSDLSCSMSCCNLTDTYICVGKFE